jgi:hypothetical protein
MFSLKICVLQIISLPWIELLKTKRINQIYIFSVEPGYNDIAVCDTSSISSDILQYKLIPHCYP